MSIALDGGRQTGKIHSRGPVVDLQLAQTYVPGLYCLLRSSIVILFMTRSNVSEDMPILMVMSVLIYVNRTIRNESLFDSNTVTMSVLLSHMFNLLRVREVPVETMFVAVYPPDNVMGLTKLGAGIQFIYCVMSAILVSDYRIGGIFSGKTSQENNHNVTFTLLLHAVFMSTMVFIHISLTSMNQVNTIGRSMAFTCLSILWSYVVGVKNTVTALHMKEDCKVCHSSCAL
jgi:hypothetical protein